MRRLLVSLGLASVLVVQMAGAAQAQKKKARDKAAPMSEQIARDLGQVQWGMTMAQVTKLFADKVEQDYAPKIAKVHSAIKEDQLRAKMKRDIKKIQDSAVRFNGTKTGWDVSFLKGEFTHHNNESLLVVEDGNSKNFYFFIRDKLWKLYKAFDSSVFQGADFAKFASAVEGRYGAGVKRDGEATPGAGKRQWIEWQDGNTRLRAIDQTGFYGFYCLVFDDKKTLGQLAELRRNNDRTSTETHSLVEHVTAGEDASDDMHRDVADRITGRLRNTQNAPKGSGSSASSKGAPPPSSAPPPTVSDEDDPLRGLF